MKHGWKNLDGYIHVHEKVLKRYAAFMQNPKPYSLNRVTDNYFLLTLAGQIMKTNKGNRVRIDITKDIEIDDTNKKRLFARTQGYTYSANVPKGNNLIRYCSPHDDDSLDPTDHHRFHHKHVFIGSTQKVEKLGSDDWPHVSEFLKEVFESF